jgi:long-chain acyl-CoA synthetase
MNEHSRLFDFLDHQLYHFPKNDLLSAKEEGRWVSQGTAEVKKLVDKLSAALISMGISGNDMTPETQDKIAVISRNRPEWLILDLACQQTGALLCPVYPTTHVNELQFIFNDAAVKMVFVSGEEILSKVDSIRSKVPSLKQVYSFDKLDGATYWQEILQRPGAADYEQLEKIKSGIRSDHCATIIYTSGTTGFPKGVMLSHRNIVTNVLNAVDAFPFEQKTAGRSLSFLPLNHIFERMVSYIYLYRGISIYYAESLETIGDNIREIKPHLFSTVPRLLEKVYDKIMDKGATLTGIKKKLFYWAVELANQYDVQKSGSPWYRMQLSLARKLVFSKWREALGNHIEFIITGGAACQVRLIRIFTAAGIPIYEGYGPTENSPVISVNCRFPGGTKFGTVGCVLQGQEVRLEPDGEICVKGPSVMMGYYKRPDLTAETIIDGWLYTGDIGVFEEDRYLKITDRKKELFKTSGGKYVAPQPIENKMKESPFVEQMMIVGAEQKYVGALIVPSIPNLREWMRAKNIPFVTAEDAVNNPDVLRLYRELVDSFNKFFNQVEQVKRFELLPDEWTVDTGELTPTLKLKRKVIMEKYRDAVERIYR